MNTCNGCGGTGYSTFDSFIPCPYCDGQGSFTVIDLEEEDAE